MEFRDLKKQYEILKPGIDRNIEEVLACARFISGPQVKELEQRLAEYVGVKYCVTCGNGTDALTLALKVWEIEAGDAVFVPDFTFFSSGECPACEGAAPIFVDVDPHTYNIDPDRLEEAIRTTQKEGKYTPRAVIAVDLFGQPADYDRIREICERYQLYLLEDGAQGFGESIRGKKACSFGDIGTTSFFPAKPLGCYGDGGAVFTDHEEWADRIRSLAVHGKSKTNKYDNLRLGMNSRLDTLQAAILMAKLDAFEQNELSDVNHVAEEYREALKELPLILPEVKEGFTSSWAQYTVQLPKGADRDLIQAELRKNDIPTMVYYMKPMHLQKAFEGTDSATGDFPVTEQLSQTVLSLPMHPYMTPEQVRYIAEKLRMALAES